MVKPKTAVIENGVEVAVGATVYVCELPRYQKIKDVKIYRRIIKAISPSGRLAFETKTLRHYARPENQKEVMSYSHVPAFATAEECRLFLTELHGKLIHYQEERLVELREELAEIEAAQVADPFVRL